MAELRCWQDSEWSLAASQAIRTSLQVLHRAFEVKRHEAQELLRQANEQLAFSEAIHQHVQACRRQGDQMLEFYYKNHRVRISPHESPPYGWEACIPAFFPAGAGVREQELLFPEGRFFATAQDAEPYGSDLAKQSIDGQSWVST
jgi:hypothetical protein